MNYRIRYRRPGHTAESEALVEPNTPTEALVKFRCIRGGTGASHQQDEVTSVSAADSAQSSGQDML